MECPSLSFFVATASGRNQPSRRLRVDWPILTPSGHPEPWKDTSDRLFPQPFLSPQIAGVL